MTEPTLHPRRVEDLPLPPDAVERIAYFVTIIKRVSKGHGNILIELRGDTVFVSGGERYIFSAKGIDTK